MNAYPSYHQNLTDWTERLLNAVELDVLKKITKNKESLTVSHKFLEAISRCRKQYYEEIRKILFSEDPRLVKQTQIKALARSYHQALLRLAKAIEANANMHVRTATIVPNDWSFGQQQAHYAWDLSKLLLEIAFPLNFIKRLFPENLRTAFKSIIEGESSND